MPANIKSCAVIGLDGVVVEVEVDTRQSLPGIVIVGLPDAAVQESRERVQSAIKNSGFSFPRKKITVNLAPASIRKVGPIYDLPIALGILVVDGQLSPDALEDTIVVGELSLDGSLRHVSGVLPMVDMARKEGFKNFIVPIDDANEAALIPDINTIAVENLAQLYEHLVGISPIEPQEPEEISFITGLGQTDFKEVKGQEHVKRALEIAAAGAHNVLMIGPPGSGKTLLARAMPGILPKLSLDEALDVTRIYSIADQLADDQPLIESRPFRSPHHTISHAGLVGGGNWPQPGEISLSHRGILFLDELPEFGQRVLETLRQPIEDKVITISRAQGSLTFPANFQLIAAMNPCPCGFYGSSIKECSCSNSSITRYQKRISGPLLDRIDIHVDVPFVDYDKLTDERTGTGSDIIQSRVEIARQRQIDRFTKYEHVSSNSDMRVKEIREFCILDPEGESLIASAMRQMRLSARAYHRILKLSRTIADLANVEKIKSIHIAEALQYRPKESLLN
jgi:magnesium chelatase family protein